MGYDMREGTVVRWLKKEGERVNRGEVIAEIETDKATVEFESFAAGVLRKIIAQEGVAIPVGQLIAVIGTPDEPLPESLVAQATATAGAVSPPSSGGRELEGPRLVGAALPPQGGGRTPAGEARASPIARRLARERSIDLSLITGTGPSGRIVEEDVLAYQPAAVSPADSPAPPGGVKSSPIARRLARERRIDLALVNGTGPGGRIVEADVLAYQAPPAAPAPAAISPARVELSRMRQAIARVTADSKREAPHFYLTAEIDMSKAMSLRREVNETVPAEQRVSVNDLMIKACAMALREYPKFNAFFRGDHLQMNAGMNIGIAIALEAGLMVPGISSCEGKSLLQIAAASRDLVARANSGTLRNEEYSGTTFSISNLGMFDVDSFAAIIYPPHAAVLAVGTVKEQPVVRNGELAIAQVMKATLSADHRVADGAEAAQFLMKIKELLENPVRLLL
jgi:pyruvate dehydrogenase E2 component (dihydrolipoamide acetyltransferase)